MGGKSGASLYKRLSALGYNGGTVADTMNKYVSDGNFVTKFELDSCVKQLRNYGQYTLALAVMEWMNKSGNGFAPTDIAKYLDLTAKVEGISAAEYYFNGLLRSQIHKSAYGALLNCFCKEGLADKAHALFVKMDKMGIVSSIAFNNLMTLYMKLHQPTPEDVNRFMEYLKKDSDVSGAEKFCEILKKIKPLDHEAYKFLLEIYVAASKIEPEMHRRIMDDGIEISSDLENLLGKVLP